MFVFRAFVEDGLVFEGCFGGVAAFHTEFMKDAASVGSLGDEYWSSGMRAMDIEAEKPFDGSQIAKGELLA